MQNIPHHSHDSIRDNFEKIQKLFPSVVDEVKDENGNIKKELNIDELKKLFDNKYNENPIERYSLNWPGKRRSLIRANTPLTDTLRPVRDESVDFDTTKNLYIEWDNFAVLKTLQHAYMGKVKMIYIDPPYNTGKDFVYNDNFTEDLANYREKTGEIVDGVQMEKNTDTNGRFHSDWLSMMYERLIVARDLLTDDGVIFMSIDDNEVHNLRKLADEVFGEENFVGNLIWKTKTAAKWVPTTNMLVKNHDYILVYSKWNWFVFRGEDRDLSDFSNPDNDSRWLWKADNMKSTVSNNFFEIIMPWTGWRFEKNWAFSEKSIQKMIAEGRIIWPANPNWTPRQKRFLSEMTNDTTPIRTLFGEFQSETATNHLKELLWWKFFDFPKSVLLLSFLIKQVTKENDLILDFFSGSATTAHAVMQLNAEDGGNRQFILVQIPELVDEGSEAHKAGYKNICEIGKERIRRAAAKIRTDFASQIAEREMPLDTGFRVYKLDSTCRANNELHPFDTTQMSIGDNISAFKSDRSAEDILTEILLCEGQMLSGEIVSKKVGENTIYIIDGGIVACLDKSMSDGLTEAIIAENPHTIIFSDEIFGGSDSLKINTENKIETAFGKGNVSVKVF